MIDISNVVIRIAKEAVSTAYPTCDFLSDNPDVISKFPAVTIVEIDNATYDSSLDNTYEEHHARVTYDISVYTNNVKTKRKDAKAILNLIDNAMIKAGFKRYTKQELPNIDRTVYRLGARYNAIVSAPYTDSKGNTVHDIYRR